MAVLEKIRSKGALLVGAVGVALLAFIIGDFLRDGSTFFNKSRETVAKIAGETINIKEYTAAIEQLTEVYKIESGQNEVGEEMQAQLRNSVWDNLVNEKLLSSEAEKLGLAVGKDELFDRCSGSNIHPLIAQRRAFMDEKGQFSRPMLVQFLNSLDQTATSAEMQEQINKAKNYWKFWENAVKNSILQEKYIALLSKAVTANDLDAKASFNEKKSSVDVSYVFQPYFTISENGITVTDKEIKDRYNKMKELFKQEENCSLNFVSFAIKPMQEDYKEAESWVNRLSEEFKTTDDVAGVVNSNSDIMYTGNNYSAQTVPSNLKTFAFGGKKGDIMGPVFENNTYTMARIMESGIMSSDSVKLRHIFLVDKDASKADSIMSVIRSGGDFAALAAKFSAVKQTAANGGEIGWIQEGTQGFDKEIADKAFAKSKNEVFSIKNTQGVQIIQVMDKTPLKNKVKLAILQRKVVPSNRSYSKIYNDAKQFAASVTAENFDKIAKEKGYMLRNANDILKSSDKIANIPHSREIVRWVFKSDKGDVSDVFDCNTEFVVALTTEINDKGYKSVDKVKDQIKAELIKDKKAEQMIASLSKQISEGKSLEALALSLNDSVRIAKGINFASFQFGSAGFEPAVIGKSSVVQIDKVVGPIKGNTGVFVIKTFNKVESPQPYNAKFELMQLNGRSSYSFPYLLMQNMKEKADIVDNRMNFF